MPRPTAIDMSLFSLGRNGEDNPTKLALGQGVEQINIRTNRDIIENKPGEKIKGTEISSTGALSGLSVWKEGLMAVHDTSLYLYATNNGSGSDLFIVKTGLTADTPMSFLEYYDDLYCSNGVDTVFKAVRSDLAADVATIDTTITLDDAAKFTDGIAEVYIAGDLIDYIGVSAGTILNKVFADSPYTTTLAETTINFDATDGNSTVDLITAVGNTDKVYIIRKTDASANTVTIDGNASETVLGAATQVLSDQGDSVVIKSDGANWIATTLTFANATVLDNVTNITSAHSENDVVTQTQDVTAIPKGVAMAEYGEKFWVGAVTATNSVPTEPWRLHYSVTATAASPENFVDFSSSGSGQEFLAHGKEITSALRFRDTLIIGKKDGFKYISGFTDATPPIPTVKDFYKDDGPINEDCLILVNSDVVYFTGKRIKRLLVPEGFDSIKQDEPFDRPVLDILKDLDTDQSEASMVYNSEKNLLFLSVKTDGSTVNNLRIVYSTDTGAWWLEENMFCRKYTVLNGVTYYAHSIIGRVVEDATGLTKDGASDTTFYESFHLLPTPSRRRDYFHLYLSGALSTGTTITVKCYVDDELIITATVDLNDITQTDSSSEAVGDEVLGDSMWGGGTPGEDAEDSRKRFEKWIPIGKKGKKFYYTIESNGLAQEYKIETAEVYQKSIPTLHRLQSTN